MFADDTALFASGRWNLMAMLRDVKIALADHGLALNVEKCGVQSTSGDTRPDPHGQL